MLFAVIKSLPVLTNIGKQFFEKAEKQKNPNRGKTNPSNPEINQLIQSLKNQPIQSLKNQPSNPEEPNRPVLENP